MENDSQTRMKTLEGEQAKNQLDSWKEIAAYLNRNVRTVQRWEKCEGLPVHRHVHEKGSSVSARKREIDAWQKNRSRIAGEITADQEELEFLVESLKAVLLVKRMRETLAMALGVPSLENPANSERVSMPAAERNV